MIPYLVVPDLKLGPITLHPFGLLVAFGVITGISLAHRRARRLGYDALLLDSFIRWVLAFGFVGGHVLDEIFYHPDRILARPWSLLMLWDGLSSYGGFVGAALGALLWKHYFLKPRVFLGTVVSWPAKRSAPIPILPFVDLLLAVFPVAWIFGRSGCTVVHDHPGALVTTDGAMRHFAVAYPSYPSRTPLADGPIDFVHRIAVVQGDAPRWDLGLLELFATIAIAAFVALAWRRRTPVGFYVAAVAFAYAPVRFFLDFLRAPEAERGADLRYAHLTFAQYGCITLLLVGIGVVLYMRRVRGIDLAAPILSRSQLQVDVPHRRAGTIARDVGEP